MGNDSNRWRSSAIGTPLRTLPRTAVDFVKQAVDASSQRCELAVDGNGCRCGLSGLFLQIRDHDRQSDPQSVITNRSTGLLYSRRIERALARQWRQTTTKRTISTLAILGTLAWPGAAKAGEIPSKTDMFNSLLVVGIYTRRCATPLSEPVKARIRTVTRLLGDMDSKLLEFSIMAYSDGLAGTDLQAWCRETGEALREGSK